MTAPIDALEQARCELTLSHGELWMRYFELGGMSTALEVEAYLCGALTATSRDRDLIAIALNERFHELGGDHPLAYSDEPERR